LEKKGLTMSKETSNLRSREVTQIFCRRCLDDRISYSVYDGDYLDKLSVDVVNGRTMNLRGRDIRFGSPASLQVLQEFWQKHEQQMGVVEQSHDGPTMEIVCDDGFGAYLRPIAKPEPTPKIAQCGKFAGSCDSCNKEFWRGEAPLTLLKIGGDIHPCKYGSTRGTLPRFKNGTPLVETHVGPSCHIWIVVDRDRLEDHTTPDTADWCAVTLYGGSGHVSYLSFPEGHSIQELPPIPEISEGWEIVAAMKIDGTQELPEGRYWVEAGLASIRCDGRACDDFDQWRHIAQKKG
jgi:hypothetical protein